MNRKKFLSISLIILVMVTLFFIIKNIVPRNKYLSEIVAQFDNILYHYDSFDDELPIENLRKINSHDENMTFIAKEEALEDIEYLFSLLKFGYAGYEYFGGDEKFLPAKKNMIWSVVETYGNHVDVNRLLDIIYSELKFIQDSHFDIGHYRLCNYTKYFSSRRFNFNKDEDGFYTLIDNELYYLIDIDGNLPNCYMKQSLDDYGNMIYNLGTLSETTDVSIPLNLLLKSETGFRSEKVSLFEYIPIYKDKPIGYRYYQTYGIPVLEVTSLSRITPEDKSIEKFIEDSKDLGKKENIILDLRSNQGGSMINVEEWYKGFTGTTLKKDIIQSGLYTNTSISLSKSKFEAKENETEEVKSRCLKAISGYEDEKYFPGWSPIKYEDFKPIDNKVNIYILVDKNTSSAAEFFVYYLRKLNNVTIIGTNTNGCMLTGNCNTAYLPNSNIQLHISHKIYLNKEMANIDGFGLLPDLWIKPEQALSKVVKYIRKNK